MPFVKYETEDLSSMRQAAEIVGLTPTYFWTLVREKELVPAPSTQVGRREYYSQQELDKVIRDVAELRRKGVI